MTPGKGLQPPAARVRRKLIKLMAQTKPPTAPGTRWQLPNGWKNAPGTNPPATRSKACHEHSCLLPTEQLV